MDFMSEIALDRRNFLRAASAVTALSYSRVMGANDRIQLGVIGCGDRGRYDMGNFQKANADVVAVCDIYAPKMDAVRHEAPQAKGFGVDAIHVVLLAAAASVLIDPEVRII